MLPAEELPGDGRLARSARARVAVVDALLDLIDAGDLQPTAPRIAERAGVSLRSVFHYFADLEALFAAAAARQHARLRPLLRTIPPTGPLALRLRAFVVQRARLLERIAPVRRAALLMEPFSPEVARGLQQVRAAGQREVARVFAPELRRHRPADRRDLVAALATVASFPTWETLRVHQGLPPDRARKLLTRMLQALLQESH
jgi:AcrR family transcriptional regulator